MVVRAFIGSLREYRQWRCYLRHKYGKTKDWWSKGGVLESALVNRQVLAVAKVPA